MSDDVINAGVCSFAESGGSSVDAVLMSEDIRHVFTVNSKRHDNLDDDDKLLDKILHSTLNDVVRYISSQLSGLTTTAAAGDDKGDANDESGPSVKRQRTSEWDGRTLTDAELACTTTDELQPMISWCNNVRNSSSTKADDDDDDEAKCKQRETACACQAMLLSNSRRVFCKDCYQLITEQACDFSKLSSVGLKLKKLFSVMSFPRLRVYFIFCIISVLHLPARLLSVSLWLPFIRRGRNSFDSS